MKILMSAYSCEPGKGSERGVGWNVVREVAKYHEVWVLTRFDESGEAIEAELARNPVPNLHFVYFNLPILGSLWRWGSSGAMQIHYYLWQIQAYFVARRLHREIGFEVAQHVTFVKYSNPSFLSLLPVPFVWGPVGGGESAPKEFWRDFSWRAKTYEIMRDFVRFLGELDPFVHLTAKKSAVVSATTEDTAKRLYKMGVSNVEVLSAIGLTKEEIANLAEYGMPDALPVRFISIGRLLHWKGFHLGLRAFAQANLPNAEYWILGDGSERDRLHTLAQDLGIAQQVKFWGELPREETLAKLGECHVLVHPSLHDSGGLVCMEAMATGRPVICLDLGGPALQVTEETGFKISANHPDQAVDDLSKAMISVAKDPELRLRMGQAGQKLTTEAFSWQVKGERLAEVYEEIVAQKEKITKQPELRLRGTQTPKAYR
ncbi:glycosyltransferase family 1 protein [Brasilonema octagenarum UFV-E1]|uniref:Glycosyltransferase family 1 protein n=1 Tax=Brasilonema sennae CENA114 TaxID=415709 RepID=A0A856MGM8_9CYAN|nr:glycosyltransferase family 4 protein [Brasilonema sennae]QDL09329.1 glycosyltransferase family 1 protein [Brasilonema sennae CENA114]QDL15686.1 glycosyltransferase family 1 protein [Brasilonema octagenarum UFV-E1]